jgi:hypothetical protein
MAEASGPVMNSWRYLLDTVGTIKSPVLRKGVLDILNNPAPTFVKGLDARDKKEVYTSLVSKGMLVDITYEEFLPPTRNPEISNQPFLSAPGSGYTSHHAYPGGLVTHTAANVRLALALYEGYRETYDFSLDRDVVVASQALHDLHKPWVFQWQKTGASRTEQKLAGTGEHHTLSVAESLYRGLPPDMCVAQACAHNHPGFPGDEKGPVGWLHAAGILLGKDPVKEGWLNNDGTSLPQPRAMENFICHLGDHDWILTVPAAKWTIPLMKKIAAKEYGLKDAELEGRKFNQLRNYVFSQASIMSLYQLYTSQGMEALTRTVRSIVRPV